MGLFGGISKILGGGGGGGSSSSTVNKTEIKVEPVTNVTVDTEELAKATSQSGFAQAKALNDSAIIEANARTRSATIEATINAQTELQKSTQAKELKLAELNQEHEQQSKKNYQYLFLVVIAGGLYLMKGAVKNDK